MKHARTHPGSSGAVVAWATAGVMLLLGLTVGLSTLHLGRVGLVIALGIAASKAVVIATWFMELKCSAGTVRLWAAAGVFWFLLMVAGVVSDAAAQRGEKGAVRGEREAPAGAGMEIGK